MSEEEVAFFQTILSVRTYENGSKIGLEVRATETGKAVVFASTVEEFAKLVGPLTVAVEAARPGLIAKLSK